MSKSINDNFLMKIQKTTDLKPDNISKNKFTDKLLSYLVLPDKTVKNLNPRRYAYYKRYTKILEKDPNVLKKFMYSLKNIEDNAIEEDKQFNKLVSLYDKLTRDDNIDIKKENAVELSKKIKNLLQKKFSEKFDSGSNEELLEDISNIYNIDKSGGKLIKGGGKDNLYNYSEKLYNVDKDNNLKEKEKLNKYNNILNEIDDIVNPTKSLNVNKEDKILFVVITFIIRLISLTIVEWSLNTSYISTLQNMFILYTAIYIILLLLIVVIVNITYNYNTSSVLNDKTGFSMLANVLYYFYIIPGETIKRNGRILVHILFILLFASIPIILKSSKESDNNLDYDYKKIKDAKNLLNKYSFVSWIFTSIIALNY